MRQIHCNDALKLKVAAFNTSLFTAYRNDNFDQPHERLAELREKITRSAEGYDNEQDEMVAYLEKIEENYAQIINADVAEMAMFINQFNNIIEADNISKEFSEAIVEAMRYEDLREKEFLIMLNSLNVKTCVYCHSQLTLTVKKTLSQDGNKVLEWKGLLELDHKHAKSRYPFLCTSFFNLYPICGSCNKAKSFKETRFDLYGVGPNFNVFKFSLADDTVVNYWIDRNRENITLNFSHVDPDNGGDNDCLTEEYNEMFSVSKIYETQKDLIEELLHKQQVYTSEYNADLLNSFKDLFSDKGMFTRLVIGAYEQEVDVFKRPMTKFIQDISRDINLIDEKGNLYEYTKVTDIP